MATRLAWTWTNEVSASDFVFIDILWLTANNTQALDHIFDLIFNIYLISTSHGTCLFNLNYLALNLVKFILSKIVNGITLSLSHMHTHNLSLVL